MTDQAIKVLFSTFNSERFWETENSSTLPHFKDCQSDRIVSVMDEMQFVFSEGKSLALSRIPMNEVHKDYLAEMGYDFINNTAPLKSPALNPSETFQNICMLILSQKDKIPQLDLLKSYSDVKISPFSILPHTTSLFNVFGATNKIPDDSIVKKVNSKIYSTRLEKEIQLKERGKVIGSSIALEQEGTKMLKTGPFLIKEAYGVSGSGNILISKKSIFNSIIRHIKKQEQEGKKTSLVIEPFLDKKLDFSCQLNIASNGGHQISSIQIMENNGFKFSGISAANKQFVHFLEEGKYFQKIEEIVKKLYSEGYFGPVCVDSMLLKTNDIIPIIEINARKSMGLINERLSLFMNRFQENLKHKLITLNFNTSAPISFNAFFEHLKKENILFTKNRPKGIFPVSANTMDVNNKLKPVNSKKGRLYYSMFYQTEDELQTINTKLNKITTLLGLKTI